MGAGRKARSENLGKPGTVRADGIAPEQSAAGLNEYGIEVRDRVIEFLRGRGLLSSTDMDTIHLHAFACQSIRELTPIIAREGYTIQGENRIWQQHPALTALRTCANELNRTSNALGLTPEARNKIKDVEVVTAGDKDRFFKTVG